MTKPKEFTLADLARIERAKRAENDLEYFIQLVQPKRYLGSIHREVIHWWERSDASSHQMLLLPRDHMKSALIALRAAQQIVKNPAIRILYISSTSNLATKQLKFIKDILTSDAVRIHWPNLINKEEAKREKWTEREISVDDPKRAEEYIRDPTVFTAGLSTNIVGMHCDIIIMDDVVVASNAYTETTREKVEEQYGYLASIEGTGSQVWIVGTRYHPRDLYASLLEKEIDMYDEIGNVCDSYHLYEVKEHAVENVGDGTGEFLWPRAKSPNGQWYGFNAEELAKKRASYKNRIHFRAQYYNDPQDVDSAPIKRNQFQYYNPTFLYRKDFNWFFQREKLNVVASVDFAYSTSKTSDSTSIVVVGVDGGGNYYVLEIDRFKTDKISEYFEHILKLYQKWGFRKIRAEVSVAQAVIVRDIKENYIRRLGLSLTVDEFRPTRWQGSKEERIMAVLEPKYANGQIWHYPSGNTQLLEEELIFTNPAHDDVKDALASAIDFAVAPVNLYSTQQMNNNNNVSYHSRWGGVA